MNSTTINWKRQIIEITLIFLFGGFFEVILMCPGCHENPTELVLNFCLSGIFWISLWKGSEFGVYFLDSKLPWVDYPVKRTVFSVLWVVILTFLVTKVLDIGIDMIFFARNFEEAVNKQNINFGRVLIFNGFINLIMHGRGFLLSWRQASIHIEKLRTEQVFTQYQSLKNQVNPHFLFNSLNALSTLVYEDQDRAVEFIRKLAEVYRYVLDKKDEEVVPIADEVSFLENFVFLQKIRFGENLNINLSIKEEGGYLPPLALQLLVENAIKHNVVSDDHHLNIDVTIDNGHCIVANNVREKLEKDSTGIGLTNLKDRYKYLSNKEVVLMSTKDRFEVKIPILDFVNNQAPHTGKKQ